MTSHTRTSRTKGAGKRTVDHETIRHWVNERGGHPATVKTTERKGSPGILRIDFPGYSGEESLEEITWEEFFNKFDCANLAMVYQEETADGKPSRFCKFVNRESEDEDREMKGE